MCNNLSVELIKSLSIHKPDLSPYNSINQHIDSVSDYSHRVTKILISNVCKVLDVRELKKAQNDAPLIFQGRIQYSPQTHKPITIKEWKKLEAAIIKYLGIESNEIKRKMIHDSMWLGSLISRMNREQAYIKNLKDMNISRAGENFNKLELNTYDENEIEMAERLGGIYLQDITDRARSKINQILINGSRNKKRKNEVFQDLWDQEEDINRDWDRVIRTESAINSNNGLLMTVLSDAGGERVFMKGISSPDACSYCKSLINEKVVVLLNSPPTNGMDFVSVDGKEYQAIWPGKTNYGRNPKNYWTCTPLHPYCYSSDTELLTNEGWKYFYELNGKEKVFGISPETNNVGWIKYSKIITYKYKGKLTNLKSKCLDLLVTNDHNNLIINKNNLLHERRTKDLSEKTDRLPRAIGKWTGRKIKYIKIGKTKLTTLQYVRLMAWYLSEGSLNRNNYINISQNDVDKVYVDLMDLPVPVQKGKTKLYIKSKDINRYMKKFGKSNEKYIPSRLKNLEKKYLEEFLRIYMLGDGTERLKKCNIRGNNFVSYRRVFFTSSKKMESDLSEIIIKIGNFPSFSKIKSGSITRIRGIECRTLNDVYNIHETYSKSVKFKKTEEEYDDNVYDIEMNKWHFFLVRRNGKAVWSGNCRCSWTEWSLELEELLGG